MNKVAILFKNNEIKILKQKQADQIEKSYTGMIIKCSKPNCYHPAETIDVHFPYFTEMNLCTRHYDIYLRYFKEFL